jgi:alanine racemase
MTAGFFEDWARTNADAMRSDRLTRPDANETLEAIFDTRTIHGNDQRAAVFLAIRTAMGDGHQHLRTAWEHGVRTFLVETDPGAEVLPLSDVVVVSNVLLDLQAVAGAWRQSLNTVIVGITGSNGKTIVKEWLSALLGPDFHVHRSPRSFNSQLGVPLSLWDLQPEHEIALIEVGISQAGEMRRLADCVRPDIGVLTHLGDAHLDGFSDENELRFEKFRLFSGAQAVILPGFLKSVSSELAERGLEIISWGAPPETLSILSDRNSPQRQNLEISWRGGQQLSATLPNSGEMAFRNAMTALTAACALGVDPEKSTLRLSSLRDVDMRMERLQTPSGHWVLSDAWTNDASALGLALEDLAALPENHPKAAIIGPISGGHPERALQLIQSHRLSKVWWVGKGWSGGPGEHFESVEDVLVALEAAPETFSGFDVLIKGPRKAAFERITDRLLRHGHATTLTINLEAVILNLRALKQHVHETAHHPVDFIAVIKASAYGASAVAIGHTLARQGVQIFAVACTQEGVELRQSGMQQRIVVFNPDASTFAAMLACDLEPEIHSIDQIQSLLPLLSTRRLPVHLKIDTGMHRLGFSPADLTGLLARWNAEGWSEHLEVASIFSHLASADDPSQDAFTRQQFAHFDAACAEIQAALDPAEHRMMRHILNSSGVMRFPEHALDAVRLGIGLYGITGTGTGTGTGTVKLEPAISLETRISALRTVPAGEGVGYGSTDASAADRVIATLPVGYADGWPRHLSHGKGWVNIHGQEARVVGKVCMDMTLVDVTGIDDLRVGDEAILFGSSPTLGEIAAAADTIPYEILSRIPARVRRIQKGG